jgi:predicted RNA binding protein YcfA (HicA-like mRNA interferase family)
MPRKGRQLKADLRRAGFVPERQKGSHVTWVHERYPDIAVVLAVQDGEDADHYEEREVRQAVALVRVRDAQEEP